jgi:hypothetical protein
LEQPPFNVYRQTAPEHEFWTRLDVLRDLDEPSNFRRPKASFNTKDEGPLRAAGFESLALSYVCCRSLCGLFFVDTTRPAQNRLAGFRPDEFFGSSSLLYRPKAP